MATSGTAYLVQPDDGPGAGVMLLHSWWGLTPATKELVEKLADAGFTAMAPDLSGGATPTTVGAARAALAESDPNVTADLILSSLVALRANSRNPQEPVGVVGYAMGASWAMWLATRMPLDVSAAVIYYGTQNIDFEELSAPVLAHFAENDEVVIEDDLVEMHARLLLSEKSVEVHTYPGTSHGFAERTPAGHFDPAAAGVAERSTIEFLRANLTTR